MLASLWRTRNCASSVHRNQHVDQFHSYMQCGILYMGLGSLKMNVDRWSAHHGSLDLDLDSWKLIHGNLDMGQGS